ncbi:MAG TPA: hypothetical protein VLF40_01490 [Candidatus Saccharimonadales bacterium]|nr:hypothetical protein [Candidatus Saccharimonadales bacterium]
MERSEELNWTDVRWEEARRLVAGGAEFEWIEVAGGQPYASLKATARQKDALYGEWATTEVMHEWLSKGIDEEYRQVLGIHSLHIPNLLEEHGVRTLRDLLVIGRERLGEQWWAAQLTRHDYYCLEAILHVGRGLRLEWEGAPNLAAVRRLCRTLHEANAAALSADMYTGYSVAQLLRLDERQQRDLAEELWPVAGSAGQRDRMALVMSQALRLKLLFQTEPGST